VFATLLGGYPVTDGPTEPHPLVPNTRSGGGHLTEAESRAIGDDLVAQVLADLDEARLELVSDGWARWPDPVRAMAGLLGRPDSRAGFDATGFDAAGVRPVGGRLVDDWRFAASRTTRVVKQAVPGPYTIGRRTGSDSDGDRPTLTLALAEAMRDELAGLAAAGCPYVEVVEADAPAIVDDPAEARLFGDAQARLTRDVDGTHLSLAFTGGSVDGADDAAIFDAPYASLAFDLIAGPDNWRVIARAPTGRGIVCGALSDAADVGDGPELVVWAAHYASSTSGRGLDRVAVANAADLRGLSRDRARAKVRALAEAARIAAVRSADELVAALDPRAVDLRTAATGRYRGRRPPSTGR
jgi:methionine synthase II (cobalamin-independent)